MVLDPDLGLFIGMRGQGFMPGQFLAKMYVDKLFGNPVPAYFDRLTMKGDGLLEKAFKQNGWIYKKAFIKQQHCWI